MTWYRVLDFDDPLSLNCPLAQVYIELLGKGADKDCIFHPSSGLLLSPDMHQRYDRYELSFYCKVSHRRRFAEEVSVDDLATVFTSVGWRLLHPHVCGTLENRPGTSRQTLRLQQIPPRHHAFASDLPSVVLLGWHYRQSAMTRFRGFAYGMEVNRMGGAVPRPEGAPEPGPDD